MATAAEIAQACRQLASQVQNVHGPQMQAVVSDVGGQLDHLATEGNEVFQMKFQPLQSGFHALFPQFQAITTFMEEHPSHLLHLASQLDAIAGNNLAAGSGGGAASGAGIPPPGSLPFLTLFSGVNGALGIDSLILYFRSVYNLEATPSEVTASIVREVDNAVDAGQFDRNASIAASLFDHQAETDLKSGGLESLLGPLGVSAEAAGRIGLGLGVLGVVGDVMTIASPGETGAVGAADRVAAGANILGTGAAATSMLGGVFAANAALDWVPVAGQVLAVGSGIYLAGDFLYQNVSWFRDGTNDVFNAVGTAGGDVVSGVATGAKDVVSGVATGAEDLASGVAGGIGNAAKSLWSAL